MTFTKVTVEQLENGQMVSGRERASVGKVSGTERSAAVINPTGKLHLKYSWVAGRDTRGRGRNIVSFMVQRRLKCLDVVGGI